jgi:hypothetical protein
MDSVLINKPVIILLIILFELTIISVQNYHQADSPFHLNTLKYF